MKLDQVNLWLENNKIELSLALIGIILVGGGVFWWKSASTLQPKVEVLSTSNTINATEDIYVDISGSVMKPGVYKLASGSRVEDALQAAGGLSDQADVQWVATNLNRAQLLVDGTKLYIPRISDTTTGTSLVKTADEKVSINSASQSELESLSGVGPVTAEKIINNRPYQTVEELLTKKVLGQKLYDSLKDQLSVW